MSARRPELSEEEYLDIEEALASNARGRTFLRMRDQRARVIALNDVRKLMREVKDSLKKESEAEAPRDDAHIRILREELREMAAYMHQTRREIAALRPVDAGANRIMAAQGELEGIVSATERATSDILNGVERIQALAMKLPKDGEVGKIADDIQNQVTEVLTACSFQDITGQRTTKVVNTLRYIEQRVNSMIEIWGVQAGMSAVTTPGAVAEDNRPDAHLMNGPAADGGPSQADVDALFEQLGKATEAGSAAAKPADGQSNSQSQIDAMFGTAH
ncbi:MAG TPA: protein phosphatase CheZ [Stellaceae bacterium]|nr:protein phosphatase CheZ [Stellaceae bacterium]